MTEIEDWLLNVADPNYVWFAKRLAANDTLANNANQAGPYVPKSIAFRLFPQMDTTTQKNPDALFSVTIASHDDQQEVRAVYYNNRFFENPKNGRDETRFTRWGGGASAVLAADNTGALVAFAFRCDAEGRALDCQAWVCRTPQEESLLEDLIGPIEPGQYILWSPVTGAIMEPPKPAVRGSCYLTAAEIPEGWLTKFPTGEEVIRKAISLRSDARLPADDRLIARRACEFEVFKSVENAFFLPRVEAGFRSLHDFISVAQAVLQSRKSRAGNSLEIHAREIFVEEGLVSGTDFHHKAKTEGGKLPDFIFPSQAAYENRAFPADRLRMLAAKTTCKDRWRQILNEADRIPVKHLLTLQEGVSDHQFQEMKTAGVQLVVPSKLREKFNKSIRPELMTLSQFIADVRQLSPRA